VKGLYAKARKGEIPEFTGISAPYEEPEKPELVLDTNTQSVEESTRQLVAYLEERGILSGKK
jgi:adenylylsulfate kinase